MSNPLDQPFPLLLKQDDVDGVNNSSVTKPQQTSAVGVNIAGSSFNVSTMPSHQSVLTAGDRTADNRPFKPELNAPVLNISSDVLDLGSYNALLEFIDKQSQQKFKTLSYDAFQKCEQCKKGFLPTGEVENYGYILKCLHTCCLNCINASKKPMFCCKVCDLQSKVNEIALLNQIISPIGQCNEKKECKNVITGACKNCNVQVCDECFSHAHRGHSHSPDFLTVQRCQNHAKVAAVFQCGCDMFLCRNCVKRDAKIHKEHGVSRNLLTKSIVKATEEYQDSIVRSKEKVNSQYGKLVKTAQSNASEFFDNAKIELVTKFFDFMNQIMNKFNDCAEEISNAEVSVATQLESCGRNYFDVTKSLYALDELCENVANHHPTEAMKNFASECKTLLAEKEESLLSDVNNTISKLRNLPKLNFDADYVKRMFDGAVFMTGDKSFQPKLRTNPSTKFFNIEIDDILKEKVKILNRKRDADGPLVHSINNAKRRVETANTASTSVVTTPSIVSNPVPAPSTPAAPTLSAVPPFRFPPLMVPPPRLNTVQRPNFVPSSQSIGYPRPRYVRPSTSLANRLLRTEGAMRGANIRTNEPDQYDNLPMPLLNLSAARVTDTGGFQVVSSSRSNIRTPRNMYQSDHTMPQLVAESSKRNPVLYNSASYQHPPRLIYNAPQASREHIRPSLVTLPTGRSTERSNNVVATAVANVTRASADKQAELRAILAGASAEIDAGEQQTSPARSSRQTNVANNQQRRTVAIPATSSQESSGSLKMKIRLSGPKVTTKPGVEIWDDYCSVCNQGGQLICCFSCPKVYHNNCHVPNIRVTADKLPDDWQCNRCVSRVIIDTLTPRFSRVDREACAQVLMACYKDPNHSEAFENHVPRSVKEYYQNITKPMCFKSISNKIEDYEYGNISEFIYDMNLVFSNCCSFNKKGSPVEASARYVYNLYVEAVRNQLTQYVNKVWCYTTKS